MAAALASLSVLPAVICRASATTFGWSTGQNGVAAVRSFDGVFALSQKPVSLTVISMVAVT
jgi:hypothetical protein